jgi:hypothetical protein
METQFLKNSILRLCAQPRTFEFLSKKMQGLDPIKLIEILNELVDVDAALQKDNDYWVVSASKSANLEIGYPALPIHYFRKYMGHFDFLKSPHPLDFEWRNTTKSLNYLTELITEINKPEESVLLMGMPTLFANICSKDIPQNVKLVERNEPIIDSLQKFVSEKASIIKADIFKAKPSEVGKHSCAIMDPPWYSEQFFQFVWLAAQALKVGGTMIISIPPINTKPDIDTQRLEWFTYCQKQGLCIENLMASRLEYAMPFFEFNAFRAAGVHNILPFWRTGDVVTFKKIREANTERPEFVESTSIWNEKIIESVRIRVNTALESDGEFAIKSLISPNDILPSVSKSDDRRNGVNIWTSGNRIYNVSKPSIFLKYLHTFGKPTDGSEHEKTVHSFIQMIIDFEKKEFDDYLNWLYYEMERQSF